MADQSENITIVVIVVEDDPVIRMILADALSDSGFDVIEAGHAQEAVATLAREADRAHVLFTDVHMPGEMDGIMLAHHVRMRWPWISLLVTSGIAHPKAYEMPERAHFISKPYAISNVIRHIREMAHAA